jgi:hypothetical protein
MGGSVPFNSPMLPIESLIQRSPHQYRPNPVTNQDFLRCPRRLSRQSFNRYPSEYRTLKSIAPLFRPCAEACRPFAQGRMP